MGAKIGILPYSLLPPKQRIKIAEDCV
jgi:hypothetical protein